MKTQLTYVTPEMAAVWLEKNEGNRPARNSWIKQLADLIRRGEFKLTHQGIAFDTDGRLLDGQHRLMAIVEADMTVPLLVTKDAPKETFSALDNGAKRSFSDLYGCDVMTAAVSGLLGKILYTIPSPEQQAKIMKVIAAPLNDLRTFCPYVKKGFTSSSVQAAAVIRMLAGEDEEYIKLMYWNIAHVNHSELPPIGRAFVDQIYAKMTKTRGGERFDLYARALKTFDKKSKDVARLMVSVRSASYDFTRDTILHLVEEKKPASKAPVSTRAKSTKLSHVRAA